MDFPVTEHYSRVRQLMRKIPGQDTPDELTIPSADTRKLRAKLIIEEALETIASLGVRVIWDGELEPGGLDLREDTIRFSCFDNNNQRLKPNIIGIADGCADISVVTIGTLIACGIPDVELLRMVDENNLAKFGPGSYLREDGKWVKPPDHKPPNIAGYINSLAGTWK